MTSSAPIRTETITWISVGTKLPDDEMLVLLSFDAADPWFGWHEDGKWFQADGVEVDDVTYWAEPPMGPA